MGPLINKNDSQIVATFTQNVEDTRVGRVYCSYLASHLDSVMN